MDLPNLYQKGSASGGTLGGQIGVTVDGVAVAGGQISSDGEAKGNTGRKPATVVVMVPLTSATQTVEATWNGVRGSGINMDTFASLSAVLGSN